VVFFAIAVAARYLCRCVSFVWLKQIFNSYRLSGILNLCIVIAVHSLPNHKLYTKYLTLNELANKESKRMQTE
jgi:amino acid permease